MKFSRPITPLLIFSCYWILVAVTGVAKVSHFALPTVFLSLFYFNSRTRVFSFFVLPVVATLLVYEGMSYFADFISANTHVAEPYNIEAMLFSWSVPGEFKIWPEYWQKNTLVFLDVLCGVAYFIYAFVFYAFALFIFFKIDKALGITVSLSFFIVNMMGYATYYLYAAAPPWYISRFGFVPADLSTPPYAAGALRFDDVLGSPLMENLYSNGSIVFGSIPSLHVAYPFLIIPFAFLIKRFRVSGILFFLLVSFSAVYLNHHYIIDILLGAAYSGVAYWFAIMFKKRFHSYLSRPLVGSTDGADPCKPD